MATLKTQRRRAVMQTAADSDRPDIQNHDYRSVVLDLVTLAERIQASVRLLERATSCALPRGNPEAYDNIFVLDDVTPCYARASAALRACQMGLGEALHLMLSTRVSGPRAEPLIQSRGAGCK
jgi:hypothetical protein